MLGRLTQRTLLGLEIVRLVAVSLVVLVRIEWGLRTKPLPALAEALGVPMLDEVERDAVLHGRPPTLVGHAGRRQRAARLTERLLPTTLTCLRRCLLLGHLLRGLGPRLQLGVRLEEDRLLAHSWLVIAHVSLDPDSRYYASLEESQ